MFHLILDEQTHITTSMTPAKRKAATKGNSERFPVQNFLILLMNLATITKNRV